MKVQNQAWTASILPTLSSHFWDKSLNPVLHSLHFLCKPDQLYSIQKNIKMLIKKKYQKN